ncbi:MAG TPA: universal stress protein [Natronosporangium sp.]|nr:universal stress protein [Natronosporangium sp.]
MVTIAGHPVVVGVDGREGSLAAADFAAAEARLRGVPLLMLSACPARRPGGPHTTLTAFLRRVCTAWPELRVTARNLSGDPVEALVAASRQAPLVVVGRDVGRHHPYSVGQQVAAHAFCPTVVVPPGASVATGEPVLLGVAMTPDDEPATAFAFHEAELRRAPLLAAHVWSGDPGSALGRVDPFAYDMRQAQEAADRMLAEALAGWADKYPDVKVERMPLYDTHPASTLLDACELAGLVVVGARRHGLRSTQLLGSVTRTLMRHSSRPVVVVRPQHQV